MCTHNWTLGIIYGVLVKAFLSSPCQQNIYCYKRCNSHTYYSILLYIIAFLATHSRRKSRKLLFLIIRSNSYRFFTIWVIQSSYSFHTFTFEKKKTVVYLAYIYTHDDKSWQIHYSLWHKLYKFSKWCAKGYSFDIL